MLLPWSDMPALGAALVAAAGLTQTVAGWAAVRRFRVRRPSPSAESPAVTVLKPLHGDEPLLEEALASFCAQDYPRFQIVFGLQDPADPALHVLHRLRARFPDVDMTAVIDPTPHGANRKVANLINMLPFARHGMLVIADSDIHAAPDYLRHLVAALAEPGVGLVTTLYAGLPATGAVAAQLGAAHINHAFLPGALLARHLGREDCLGATMALRRETLDAIGGLEALAHDLADDAVLGRLVAAQGLSVRLAPTVPGTTVPETRLQELFQHELRWARTIQSLVPVQYALSAVQFPLFWAMLAAGFSGVAQWSLALLGMAWATRALAATGVDRSLKLDAAMPIWLLPLRDALSVAVILASYAGDNVEWRGQILSASRPALAPEEG